MVLAFIRLIHVVNLVAWAGGFFLLVGVVEPLVRSEEPDGDKAWQRLRTHVGLVGYMNSVAFLTAVSGFILTLHQAGFLSGAGSLAWFRTEQGSWFALGSVAEVGAFLFSLLVARRTAVQHAQVWRNIQELNRPPSPLQINYMRALEQKMARNGRFLTLLLFLAILAQTFMEYKP